MMKAVSGILCAVAMMVCSGCSLTIVNSDVRGSAINYTVKVSGQQIEQGTIAAGSRKTIDLGFSSSVDLSVSAVDYSNSDNEHYSLGFNETVTYEWEGDEPDYTLRIVNLDGRESAIEYTVKVNGVVVKNGTLDHGDTEFIDLGDGGNVVVEATAVDYEFTDTHTFSTSVNTEDYQYDWSGKPLGRLKINNVDPSGDPLELNFDPEPVGGPDIWEIESGESATWSFDAEEVDVFGINPEDEDLFDDILVELEAGETAAITWDGTKFVLVAP